MFLKNLGFMFFIGALPPPPGPLPQGMFKGESGLGGDIRGATTAAMSHSHANPRALMKGG